ncbi:MAG: hypothetical protein KC506_00335, partial [Nanoarchaeota archaeon]|nr:hypothetical protein [Nanoarchaeota archaeon]
MKREMMFGIFVAVLVFSFMNFVVGQGEIVGKLESTVCCEETKSGLFCQDVPQEECKPDARQPNTACESTSFCSPGYCYDDSEGTCLDNVPQQVCKDEGGTWSEEKPASCEVGCCVLGDQASFTTLVRCKRLSSFYGLETNYDSDIQDELQCVLSARGEEKGACVYQEEFETNCKITKRSECVADKIVGKQTSSTREESNDEQPTENNSNSEGDVQTSPAEGEVEFHPNKLCTAPELNTICGKSESTTCLDGFEEVYFVDTCGNPANIYDASRLTDDTYWDEMIDKRESCDPNDANINDKSCGNCNYLQGSFCRSDANEGVSANFGDYICADLNCYDEEMGEERIHGESWCAFDVEKDFEYKESSQNILTEVFTNALRGLREGIGVGLDFRGGDDAPVGSKYYRKVCIHGEIITEPCADFRQEECIENTADNGYTSAQCRVNRWQDCTAQFTQLECENSDKRDCSWLEGKEYVLIGSIAQVTGSITDGAGTSSDGNKPADELKKFDTGERELGACVPKNPPGLKFWESSKDEDGNNVATETMTVCSQANAECPVTFEKKLSGGDWECIENCECLESSTELKRSQVCMALGDCGPKVNIVQDIGRGPGYKLYT